MREGGRERGLLAGESDQGVGEEMSALIPQGVVGEAEDTEGGETRDLRVDETGVGVREEEGGRDESIAAHTSEKTDPRTMSAPPPSILLIISSFLYPYSRYLNVIPRSIAQSPTEN